MDCEIKLQRSRMETDMVAERDMSEGKLRRLARYDRTTREYHWAAILPRMKYHRLWSSNVAERERGVDLYGGQNQKTWKNKFQVRPHRSKRKINRHIYCHL